MENHSIQVARYILGLSWIYHGFFPKLITVAPIEKAMTASMGYSEITSYWLTKSAGVAEIIFGLLIMVYYKNKRLMMTNIVALVVLCIFVAVQMPRLLIEAFNPVTTNLALIGLSYILLNQENLKEK